MAVAGAGACAQVCHGAIVWAKRRGTKSPKCWACWPAAQPLRGPSGLLKGVLLIEHAGTKALEPCGVSIGLEASGQLGVVRATVSRVLLPGAACDVAHVTCTVHGENSSCGRVGTARFCERVGSVSALPRPLTGWA